MKFLKRNYFKLNDNKKNNRYNHFLKIFVLISMAIIFKYVQLNFIGLKFTPPCSICLKCYKNRMNIKK